jgi:hypothetical protein
MGFVNIVCIGYFVNEIGMSVQITDNDLKARMGPPPGRVEKYSPTLRCYLLWNPFETLHILPLLRINPWVFSEWRFNGRLNLRLLQQVHYRLWIWM